jgi:hypothetical protein
MIRTSTRLSLQMLSRESAQRRSQVAISFAKSRLSQINGLPALPAFERSFTVITIPHCISRRSEINTILFLQLIRTATTVPKMQ